jgi:protein-S-isoprenylcysteine O-methyltransferase Ste14/DNA-binding transcriptional ArsR family regulator
MSPRSSAAPSLKAAAPLFAALGDETRLSIVARLCAAGPTSIAALTTGSGVTRQAVAKHLRVLADAGLVRGAREGRESSWELQPEKLEEARRSLASISSAGTRPSIASRPSWRNERGKPRDQLPGGEPALVRATADGGGARPGVAVGAEGGWSVLERVDPVRGALGGVMFAGGLALLVWTVSLFIRVGRGTLAPWDPTRTLVVVGPFARVRNPMIAGVFFMIAGEAVALAAWRVAIWAAVFFLINHLYFLLSEEPGLVKRFGAEYEEYRRHVPRWLPRRTPWRPRGTGSGSP